MRIAEVIGKVTLSKCPVSLYGATWLIAVPLTRNGLQGDYADRGEPLVVYDEMAANESSIIAISEGVEAVAPFHPEVKPIDAYNAAILDSVQV